MAAATHAYCYYAAAAADIATPPPLIAAYYYAIATPFSSLSLILYDSWHDCYMLPYATYHTPLIRFDAAESPPFYFLDAAYLMPAITPPLLPPCFHTLFYF